MASFGIWDSVLVYGFVKRLVKPFRRWKAFQTGVIDEEGKIIVPPEKRTSEQKASFKLFDLLVLRLKRLLAKIPGGGSTLASYAAALMLLKEGEDAANYSEKELCEKLEIYMREAMEYNLLEDAPTNAAGGPGGHIAGVSDNDPPGGRFAGSKVFRVSSDKFWKSRMGKHPRHRYKKYVEEDDEGEEIRQYGRKNPKASIVLQDKTTGAYAYLRRPGPKITRKK